jgi:hypothetical protein
MGFTEPDFSNDSLSPDGDALAEILEDSASGTARVIGAERMSPPSVRSRATESDGWRLTAADE